ncbi:helix-turn-helix domain-containing protein [Pedobacter aquatilis]|uniref:helix-turn-helix transcriptional regulator n=1 Tax=Pedobacter aquatilis TaxID=351343 RepID=UPI0025B3FEA4|nr:helix-turn-helix domain-containing protein [Pedobacter aquatilis]MDN3586635.1 helix-turn-helix domain-containing protein [Pedobacter aquatilis]
MKYSKVLANGNTIVSETSCDASSQHKNTNYTIKFVFGGSENYGIQNRNFNIYPDSFAVLNAGTQFISKIESITPVRTFSISFTETFINEFHKSLRKDNKHYTGIKFDSKTFSESVYPFSDDIKQNVNLLKNYLDKGLNDEILINEYMHDTLLNYYKIYDEEFNQRINKLSFVRVKTKQDVLKRLTIAKEYMSSNFNKNITLEGVAEHCCLSVNHFLKTFKEAYDVTPYQYLVQIRLKRAKDLLQYSNYSLNEIVNMVGFECPSSFIRLFKNNFKITPSKYKKSRLN